MIILRCEELAVGSTFSKVSKEIQFCTISLDSRISITPTKALPHLADFRTEAAALNITHFYKGNVVYDHLRQGCDEDHIPSKVIVPPDYKSSAMKWVSGAWSSSVDRNTGTNETDFIKRYLIYERGKLSYFEIAGLVLASDLLAPTITVSVCAWHCYGNPTGWQNLLSPQRVMRREWWTVCWRPCSPGLPSATEGKGHQSQKVNIILVSCYFLGNSHREQPFYIF